MAESTEIAVYRIGVQYSNLLPSLYAVFDEFRIIMQHHCTDDMYTFNSNKADFLQVIYASSQTGGHFGSTHVSESDTAQSDSDCASYT